MIRTRWLFVLTPILAACGSGPPGPAAAPSRRPDVVIPEVTDDQSKTAKEEPPPPAGTRENPVMPAEPVGPDPGSPDDLWGMGQPPGQPRGGPDCDKAADCCLKFYQKSGGDPSVQRICGSMRTAPASLCSSMLSSFVSAAPGIGVQCP